MCRIVSTLWTGYGRNINALRRYKYLLGVRRVFSALLPKPRPEIAGAVGDNAPVNGGGNMYRGGGAKMYHGLGGSLSA